VNYTNWRLNMPGLELKVGLIFTIEVPIKNNIEARMRKRLRFKSQQLSCLIKSGLDG